MSRPRVRVRLPTSLALDTLLDVTSDDVDVAAVELLEREMQKRDVRADRERVTELLAPTFIEIGASGRRWDLASTLSMLAEESGSGDQLPEIGITNLEGRVIAPDVIQVLCDSKRGRRLVRRSSIWRRMNSQWRLVFHQGTLLL